MKATQVIRVYPVPVVSGNTAISERRVDPMFVARGHRQSFGEMEPEQKHAISHRADALRRLVAACFGKD